MQAPPQAISPHRGASCRPGSSPSVNASSASATAAATRRATSRSTTRLAAASTPRLRSASASGPEAKAVEDPRPLAFHHNRAAVADDREERLVDPPAVTGQSRPATDEELGQLCVERVGERVLERPGALLPAARIVHPIGAMGHVGPGSNMADAGCQCIDVALGGRQPLDRATDPRRRQSAALDQGEVNPAHEADVILRHGLAEIGDLAGPPRGARRDRHRSVSLRLPGHGRA